MSSVRARRVGASAALVVFVGLAIATWVIGARVQSPSQAAARAAPPEPSWVTAPVELRVLSSTVIARGDIKPAVSTAVNGPAASSEPGSDSSDVVTGVFVGRGDDVVAGDRVVEVAGRPVFVFEGATPAFRALRPGMTGADVAQLQAGLGAVDCDAGDSGTYDEATKACVERLYADAGYATVRGSTSEVADLAAAQTAVETARDNLETAESTLRVAAQPAAAADVAAAEAAVDDAQRAYDAAVRNQPALIDAAAVKLDEALASLNAVLAESDPNAATGAAATGGDAAGGDAAGSGTGTATASRSGSSVAARAAAWVAVANAVGGVDEAGLEGADAVAAAESSLRTANDALAVLTATPDMSAEQLAVDQLRAAVERAEDDLVELEAVSGAVVPFGEVVFVPAFPARVDSVGATVGAANGASQSRGGGSGSGSSSGSLVVLASPTLQAEVSIPQSARALVQEGAAVDLLDEASGETVPGTVRSIADDVEPSALSGVPSHLAVVEAELPEAWSGRNVRATFTTASTDHEVLVVPSAAVSSAADGQTRVQVEREDGTIDTVDVETRLSADGYVEVIAGGGAALNEGDRVVIGR